MEFGEHPRAPVPGGVPREREAKVRDGFLGRRGVSVQELGVSVSRRNVQYPGRHPLRQSPFWVELARVIREVRTQHQRLRMGLRFADYFDLLAAFCLFIALFLPARSIR